MSSMRERGVFLKLSLHQVDRWAIIEMMRKQSVAEHTYNVHVLAMDLWDWLFTVPHNSFERESCGRWALSHDLDEIFTGDIASPAKDILNKIHPGITAALKADVLRAIPEAAAELRGIEKGSLAYQIVAVVDLVEAILYVRRYGIDTRERNQVVDYLNMKLANAGALLTAQSRVEKYRFIQWLTEALDPSN